jgi:DNA topoisomerase-2
MHAFNPLQQITKYEDASEIITEFYIVREEFYVKRKKNILLDLTNKIGVSQAKQIFIEAVLNGNLDMKKETVESLEKFCVTKKFPRHENSYNYLLFLRVVSLTKDSVEKLKKQITALVAEFEALKSKSHLDLYLADLACLEKKI